MRSLLTTTLIATALIATAAVPAIAEDARSAEKSTEAKDHRDALKEDAEKAWPRPPVEEQASVTKGRVDTRSGAIAYTATAGTLTIRDDAGKPTASLFYTAYTKDGGGPNRPVSFFYNGGPGSSTVWLRMGSFGPVRVATDAPIYVAPSNYALKPNPDTLLDRTDLVFIDAVGTGWSRPLGDKTGKDFWGVDQDGEAFARAIIRYIDRNDRWQSPKVLFGESYGTLRNGVVAAKLEEHGLSLDGIVMLSTILNYGVEQPGYDMLPMTLVPTYAATAWYHNKIANRPASLPAFLNEVRAWVAGPYAAALAKGTAIEPAEFDATARQLAAYTGLSEAFVRRANLRVPLGQFQTELLRDKGVATGRLDTRYLLDVADANAISPVDDPASTAITGTYVAAFKSYVSKTLGFKTDMPYLLSAYNADGFEWDWNHKAPGSSDKQISPDTGVDLAYVMRVNPALKVLFLNGYYDAATQFYATEYDINHLMLPAQLRANITSKYYESGHMLYLNQQIMPQLHQDIASWYDTATKR
jgi:carboxypeptidase C (cathepsin A)